MENENKSTILQALIELRRVTDYEEVATLIEKLQDSELRKADANLKQHQYPDSRLSFVQFSNLNKCPQLIALWDKNFKAYAILSLLAPQLGKDNLVSMPLYKKKNDSTPSIQSITGYKRDTISSALNDLLECGFLAKYKNPSRYNPTIFMVNPLVAKAGNSIDVESFWEVAVFGAKETFNQLGKDVNLKVTSEAKLDECGVRHNVSKLSAPDPNLKSITKPVSKGRTEYERRAGQEALEDLKCQVIQTIRETSKKNKS